MTKTLNTEIKPEISRNEITTTVKLTGKQADLLKDSDTAIKITRVGYDPVIEVSVTTIHEIMIWSTLVAKHQGQDKAAITRLIKTMDEELDAKYRQVNYDRNRQIEQLQRMANYEEYENLEIKVETESSSDLRVALVTNEGGYEWTIERISITPRLRMTPQGMAYTVYEHSDEWRNENAPERCNLSDSIEDAIDKIQAAYKQGHADAINTKYEAIDALEAAGIQW